MQKEEINLQTSDNADIKGTFFRTDSKKALILLHQLAKNRESYFPFIPHFNKTHNVLAIDLRGHGKSSGSYLDFSDDDFNAMKKDVASAVEYLIGQGIEPKNISLIGSSIGANTVQNYSSTNPHDKAILLSPGLNYRGIKLTMKDTECLAIVSKEDSYSYESVRELEKVSPKSKFLYLQGKGHGTNMLDDELALKIINFLNS